MRHPRQLAESVLPKVKSAMPRGCAIIPAGSYRRGLPDLHDLDCVVLCDDIERASAEIKAALPVSGSRILRGVVDGLPIDLYLCTDAEVGAMILFLTGSAEFNVRTRREAARQGLLLNQYGLFDRSTNEPASFASEEQILDAIGVGWVDPAAR